MTAVRRPPPGSTIAAMKTVALASLTADDLASLTQLVSEGVTNDPWEAFLGATLSDEDRRGLAFVLKHLRPFSVALNESTLWGRAIFPLLMLAETERIAAWSQVPVTGAAPAGEVAVTGVIDGVLAPEGALGGAPLLEAHHPVEHPEDLLPLQGLGELPRPAHLHPPARRVVDAGHPHLHEGP